MALLRSVIFTPLKIICFLTLLFTVMMGVIGWHYRDPFVSAINKIMYLPPVVTPGVMKVTVSQQTITPVDKVDPPLPTPKPVRLHKSSKSVKNRFYLLCQHDVYKGNSVCR